MEILRARKGEDMTKLPNGFYSYSDGYLKSMNKQGLINYIRIDEFADSIKTELDRFGVVNLDTCVLYDFIDRKAERLKAGGVDE